MRTPVARLPISIRLAALFMLLTLVVLAIVGAILYVRLGEELITELDQSLFEVAGPIAADLADGDTDLHDELDELDEGLGNATRVRGLQLLDETGAVVLASDASLSSGPLMDAEQLRPLLAGQGVHGQIPVDGGLRVLALPVNGNPLASAAVIATPMEPVWAAQRALLAQLVPAGLLATALAAVLGYVVARRGLTPIHRMVAEAAAINAGDLRRRLPVPDTNDEVSRLGRTLNDMLARLGSAIERERSFTADASHELRTPLAILRAEVELASDHTDDPEQKAALESALEETDRLAALVDDLLVLARADADRLDSRARIDLGDLARQTVERFRVLAAERQVTVTCRGDAVVNGDGRGLDRVLANLTDNAIRHTPAGGAVDLRVEPLGSGARVRVRDTGPGVDEAVLLGLFERFSQAEPAHERGGAGLGLAIVSAVVTAHGGRVTATNHPPGGLQIDIELP